ncbi:DNA methyltransferase [Novosphingobium sp. Gsoil 351]|uniref:class I SAM-dependent DNA methyltransferase n=1 Tax=Novosphingobium sp. Gsoil 351 TaxID=2675225 RepID=UPI0012B4B33E|nr:DNA methyltransferase [Novosphingobium sp. Gsoil 351]QGN56181.1 class I SAM-dependent DNA methyltransferase [Novosphingobium sp. Gsoil 351]
MTPHAFTAKWRGNELKERSASQSHFNDLCALLGVLDPISADPLGEWFAFEKGANKTSGGDGWADVWRRGCFAWEYKGPRKDLKAAFNQLLQYSVALENPPLLIVSDMDRIRIHTNFTNTVQEVHEFTLDDLLDAAQRERLKAAFTDPDEFKPKKTRQELTEETAAEFAGLAQRLRERGHDAHQVAHFVNRLVFCMFAEDVGLLPDKLFTKMLEVSRRDRDEFAGNARTLFGAMASKGGKVGFTAIDWFNGGLFEDDHVLPVSGDDIEQLLKAARRDWSQIDPSILGTLFERGLDPAKRSQLGAHYTDRAKIMLIVQPVIIDPLEAEWAEALARMTALVESAPRQTKDKLLRGAELAKRTKALAEAEAVHSAFVERLANFLVLDPACGSGNFLYVALRALKDIEHRANLDAEALGLPRGFPRVGPECVLGIELNPYAAELARVSVWIGEIQWMNRNGFPVAKNPILRPLETIECRDAVLNDDGTRAEWPSADVVIGNPPFLGNKKMIGELGEDYTRALRNAWPEVPGGVDLVCYWFAKAWAMIVAGKLQRAGLVATNSIRGGANREVLKPIVEDGRIFDAWSDEGWTVEGAAVRVSLVCFDLQIEEFGRLDGQFSHRISASLRSDAADVDASSAARIPSNLGISFQGPVLVGNFDIDESLAGDWLRRPQNPNGRTNAAVLLPLRNGQDLTTRPRNKWVINFRDASEAEASLFEAPFEYVLKTVKPERLRSNDRQRREKWWRLGRSGAAFFGAIDPLSRYIATSQVAKHRIFVWLAPTVQPHQTVIAIARDDDTSFGILHSRFHELWALRMGTSLEDRPRYTPSTTFETFPFPKGLTPDLPAAAYAADPRAQAIAAAAVRLNELREAWLNPADLIVRVPDFVPGYPDRIVPVGDAAAKELKKRTLTNLYNARPQWLANAHAALDQAVADAYGWGDDWRAGPLSDDEILARLFALNQDRAAVGGRRGDE